MNNAKKYYEQLVQKSNELNEKYENLKKEKESNPKVYFTIGYAKKDFEFSISKMDNFYSCLIKKIPEDKKQELNEYLKPLFYTGESKDGYFRKNHAKDFEAGRYDFEFFPLRLLQGDKSEIIEKIGSYLTDKDIEEAFNENEQLVAKGTVKEKVKILDVQVKDAKAFVEANEQDTAKKEEILKELDLINETVIGANYEYRDAVCSFDSEFEAGRNRLNSKEVDEYIEKNKPESYKYLKREKHDNSFVNEKAIAKNKEEFKNFKDNTKLNLSDKNKESTVKVLKAIEKMGIYSPQDNGSEQGTKIYGFRQIFDAQVAIEQALKNHDFSNLKELRENYVKSIENMRELYKLVKEEFNPTHESMVGNLNNQREEYVPEEFVDDLPTNATVSSLYNMLTLIKKIGCTPEEFVDDPAKYLTEFREILKSTNLNIDAKGEGKSIAATLSHPMYCGLNDDPDDPYDIYPHITIPRIIEGLRNRESDPEKKAELTYNGMFISAVDSIYSTYASDPTGIRDDKSYLANHYLNTKGLQTIANILLVNDEDRVYSKLRAHSHFDPKDDLNIIGPFNVKDYVQNTHIDPKKFINRVIETTRELYQITQEKIKLIEKQNQIGGAKKTASSVNKTFEIYLRGAQNAIQLYLLLKSPSLEQAGFEDKDIVDKKTGEIIKNPIATLTEMLKDPTKLFGDTKDIEFSKDMLNTLDEIKGKDKAIKDIRLQTEKNAKNLIKRERDFEKEFNQKASKFYKLGEQARLKDDTDTAIKYSSKYSKLVNEEVERLKNDLKYNRIPHDYYEARLKNIEKREFNKKAPILGDGIPKNIKEFIKFRGLEEDVKNKELSKEELEGLFESYKLKVEHDKQVFLNANYLVNNKFIPDPEFASKEPLHSEVKPVEKQETINNETEIIDNNETEKQEEKTFDDNEKPAPEEVKNEETEETLNNKITKIHINLDDEEVDFSSTTKISDIDKEKDNSKEKTDELDV